MSTMSDEKKVVSTDSAAEPQSPEAPLEQKHTLRDHWKCLAACSLLSLCPLQYGLDFGLISGLQAMVGFLRVCFPLCPVPLPGLDSQSLDDN